MTDLMTLADDEKTEAMKKKLLADADKPVKAVKVVDRSAGGFKAYEKAFGKLEEDMLDRRGLIAKVQVWSTRRLCCEVTCFFGFVGLLVWLQWKLISRLPRRSRLWSRPRVINTRAIRQPERGSLRARTFSRTEMQRTYV